MNSTRRSTNTQIAHGKCNYSKFCFSFTLFSRWISIKVLLESFKFEFHIYFRYTQIITWTRQRKEMREKATMMKNYERDQQTLWHIRRRARAHDIAAVSLSVVKKKKTKCLEFLRVSSKLSVYQSCRRRLTGSTQAPEPKMITMKQEKQIIMRRR